MPVSLHPFGSLKPYNIKPVNSISVSGGSDLIALSGASVSRDLVFRV